MSYNFKKINELELINEVPEGANVLIETEGATKRLPSSAINNGYTKEEVYTKEECDEKYLTAENVKIGADLIFDFPETIYDGSSVDYIINMTTVIGSIEELVNKMANGECPNVHFRDRYTDGDFKCWNFCPLQNITVYGETITFTFKHPRIGTMSYTVFVYSNGDSYISEFSSDSHSTAS